jgi:hypothetical protein
VSEWQPIETAPKDGTAIWLACEGKIYLGYGEDDERPYRSGGWELKATFRRFDDRPDEICGTWTSRNVEPTHWMPLPDPPVQP